MPLAAALAGDLNILLDTLWSAGVTLSDSVRQHRAACRTDVTVAVGEDAVALAGPAWRQIEQLGGAATAFQTHSVAQCVAGAHLRRGETPRIVVVRAGGRPCVVLPTVVSRWSGVPTIRFLGDPLIQYGDAIAAPNVAQAHLNAAWRAAADPSAARLIYLRKVRADARIAPLLARTTKAVAKHEAPFVDVQQRSPKNSRDARELRRFRRRLQEIGDTHFQILQGRAALATVREAIGIKREWIAARGMPNRVVGDSDWENAILALADGATSPLRAARLTVGGRTAAVEIGLLHDSRWFAFLGALSPDFAKAGPGHVQMAETITHCRDQGVRTYDLLAPADPYKRGLSHGSEFVCDHAAALGGSGWFGLLAARAVPEIKRLAGRMPHGLRRVLIGGRLG